MNKSLLKSIKNCSLLVFCSILNSHSLPAEELTVPKPVTDNQQLPSLDLLLYLGEFQDRDGSLLEPEIFIDSFRLDENQDAKTDKPKISSIKKEGDYEPRQP